MSGSGINIGHLFFLEYKKGQVRANFHLTIQSNHMLALGLSFTQLRNWLKKLIQLALTHQSQNADF